MNISGSEYSSGCESGWTGYFDQGSGSTTIEDYNNCSWGYNCEKGKLGFSNDEEEEDLSMVSDASSGPPQMQFQEHHCNYYDYGFRVADHQQDKNKGRKDHGKKQQHNLEDTATSPFFHFSMENVGNHENDESVGKTYGFPPLFQDDDSISKKQKGFFKSSKKGKQGSLIGRKRQ